MRKLSASSYKIVKIVHILSVCVWFGAGVSGLFLLTVILNKNNLPEILRAVHYIDLLIIIPSNIATLISGIIFSTFTEWGFLKHRWIVLKYIANIVPIMLGGILFAPSIINMLLIADKVGEKAISDPSFIFWKNIFISAFVVQLTLLTAAVCLSVIKPKLRKYKQLTVKY